MDRFSIFILPGGLSWITLHTLFAAPDENSKCLITHSLKISFCAASIPGIIMAVYQRRVLATIKIYE